MPLKVWVPIEIPPFAVICPVAVTVLLNVVAPVAPRVPLTETLLPIDVAHMEPASAKTNPSTNAKIKI